MTDDAREWRKDNMGVGDIYAYNLYAIIMDRIDQLEELLKLEGYKYNYKERIYIKKEVTL